MKMYKRFIAGLLAVASAASLSGCSTMMGEDPTTIPLEPELTTDEVKEYYKESLSFDAVVTKNLDVDTTNYELHDVTDQAKMDQLEAIISRTIGLLGQMSYTYNMENDLALDEETYHYIKAYLNDRTLSNANVVSVSQALGHYFIDVEFDVSPANIGTFTNAASLLGLNGAFVHSNYENTDKIDTAYMLQAVQKLNEYYSENGILNQRASFNESTSLFSTDPTATTVQPDFTTSTAEDTSTATTTGGTEATEGTEGAEGAEGAEGTEGTKATTDRVDAVAATSSVISIRHPNVDLKTFNTVVGSSTRTAAYFPSLELVYNVPAQSGQISGIGILPCGTGGLTNFGFNRSTMTGKMTLRFVYKDDVEDPDIIENINVYPVFSEITTGISNTNSEVTADFVNEQLSIAIQEADRAMMNVDLTALMTGEVFADMGAAVLRGYENSHVNVLRQMSTIRRVITRDLASRSYLVEVETLRQEGPKGADVYGTYRDMSYVVIQQQGQDFTITDWIVMTRRMQIEPEINPDSAIVKRLVALSLAGEVSSEAKEGVQQVLDNLYTASTYRILTGPSEVQTADGTRTIEFGMYDCFNRDPQMLSQSDFDSMNSELRGLLVKNGVNVGATMDGLVTEWIGGAENQVELMTEEVITYQGRDDGVYMITYYLLSNMEDKWVIDERQVIEQQDVSGESLSTIVNRIRG